MDENEVLAGQRVLVVEDEILVCMMIEDMLADIGCTVVGPAVDLDQALSLASEAELDAAVLDVNLNGVHSYPVADLLKKRGVPFAFATGYGTDGVGDAYQGKPVLKKPFQQRDLAKALAESLKACEAGAKARS